MKKYSLHILLLLISACSVNDRQSKFEVLSKLDNEKTAPKPNEWLYEHPEKHQTLQKYIASKPNQISAVKQFLYITLIDDLDTNMKYTFHKVCNYLSIVYNIKMKFLPAISSNKIPTNHQRQNEYGTQLHSLFILDSLLIPSLPTDAFACIAFTAKDLYPSTDWHFVFGQANLKNRVGVWSMARLHEAADENLFTKRTMQVAVHEVGHIFGITHCTQNECTMNGSNSLQESDGQPMWMCSECASKIAWNRNLDFNSYIQQLDSFWTVNKKIDSLANVYYQLAKEIKL